MTASLMRCFGLIAVVLVGTAAAADRALFNPVFDGPPPSDDISVDWLRRLPTSFRYGGVSSTELLHGWPSQVVEFSPEYGDLGFACVWTGTDGFEARLEVVGFGAPVAAEYRWVFSNRGQSPSERITEAYAVDLRAHAAEGRCVLHTAMGGIKEKVSPKAESAGFELAETPLGEKTLSVSGGRSSNGHLPFFCLERFSGEHGIAGGLGWSGQWEARGKFDGATEEVTFQAGMVPVDFRLPPGETVRMPKALFIPFEGDPRQVKNRLRRVLHERYQGKIDGKPILPPVSFSTWFVFHNDVGAAMLTELAEEAAALGIEYVCLDAGWFDGDFPDGVGNWTVNEAKFPGGLEVVADRIHELGLKFGLWFEPERVSEGTRWEQDHGDLLYESRAAGNRRLLDLSKPEARDLILKMMTGYIEELDVDWVRYDFNVSPIGFWEAVEGPEEKGLAQLRYMNGLYLLLDELKRRHPDVLIEQCASGGRRIDLEMVRLGHTFWKSDDTFDQHLMRFHESGGNEFLPAGLLNTNYCEFASDGEVMALFAGPLGFGLDLRELTADQKSFLKTAIAGYKDIRHYLNGDYYPVFPQTKDRTTWIGWQFVDPDTGEGVVIVHRPAVSSIAEQELTLTGLKPNLEYRFRDVMSGQERTVLGEAFPVSLDAGNSAVWRFFPKHSE